jgi:small subunit ribosomal protein S21
MLLLFIKFILKKYKHKNNICQNIINLHIFMYIKKNMIIIKLEKNETIEKALKRYKFKVFKTNQLKDLQSKQSYVKESEKKRNQIQKAKYVEKKKGSY